MDKKGVGLLQRGLALHRLGVALTKPALTTLEMKSTDTVRLYISKPTLDSFRRLLQGRQGASPKIGGMTLESRGKAASDRIRNEKNWKRNSMEVNSVLLLCNLGITLLALLLSIYALSESQKKAIVDALEEQLHSVLEATKDDFHTLPEYVNVTLDDVKGIDENTKMRMSSIVKFPRNPKETNLGTEMSKGVLLTGTGKTLLAKAVAGEAKVPFFYLRGSELQSSFPPIAVQRIRTMFEAAKANAPCVLFIDQIDLLGSDQEEDEEADEEENISTSSNLIRNQLVAGIDGIGRFEGVMVIASTSESRRSYVDKDFLQRGRIGEEVRVLPPDMKGRKDIIQKSLLNVKLCGDVNIDEIAERTLGFTGAELKSMVNQAAGRAVFEGADSVGKKHLDFGFYQTARLEILTKEVKSIAACHLAGVALVAMSTKYAPQIERATIIPTLDASMGEIFYRTPVKAERRTRAELMASIDILMGGIAAREVLVSAEEAIPWTAGSEIEEATRVAISLVISSERLTGDNVVILSDEETIEVNRLLRESYNRAKQILMRYARQHRALVGALVNHETLNAGQIKSILMQANLNTSAIASNIEEIHQSPNDNKYSDSNTKCT